MAKVRLNAEHIEAINAAMNFAEGDVGSASEELRKIGWDGWTQQKLFDSIRNNETLRVRWGIHKPTSELVVPLEHEMTDVHRPEVLEDRLEEISINDDLIIGSLEQHEEEFRAQLVATGEDQATADYMAAAGKLQSKFALATLNAVTGGLVKITSKLGRALEKTDSELDALMAVTETVEKALLCDREKILREDRVQLANCYFGACDRLNRAFFLQLEARKMDNEKRGGKAGRPKKMLGITAMPNSRVNIHMGNEGSQNGNGH